MNLLARCPNPGLKGRAVFQEDLMNLCKKQLNHLQMVEYPRWARRLIETERLRRKAAASTTSTEPEKAETPKCVQDKQPLPAFPSTQDNAIIFTDATLHQGAWLNQHESASIFPVPPDLRNSSFESEYYSAYRGIMDNATPDKSIQLHCDNQSVCSVLENGELKNAKLKKLEQDLQVALRTNNVSLAVLWIPSKDNPADRLSRSEL